MSAVSEFRKKVKAAYPHVKVSVRTINMLDLMRESPKCLDVEGVRTQAELDQINEWAGEARIVADRGHYFNEQENAT